MRPTYFRSMACRSASEEGVGLRQVLADRPFPLEEIGHGVAAEAVQAPIEPVLHHRQQLGLHVGVVEVEVRLVAEEAVPVVGLGLGIPRPVRALRIEEDDASVPVALVVVAPHVVGAEGRGGIAAGFLEPAVLVGRVVHHEVGDDAEPSGVRFIEEALEVGQRPVVGVHRPVVGDVVAVVPERRGEEREEPQAVHAEVLQVVEPTGQAHEVADAVVVAVLEGPDVELVEHGVLVPERVTHARDPTAGEACRAS